MANRTIELRNYMDARLLEEDVKSWVNGSDMSHRERDCVVSAFTRVNINTVQDVIDYIDNNATNPFRKLEGLIKGYGPQGTRRFIEYLSNEIENSIGEKVLEDYNAAKALNLFDEKDILQALRSKYPVSLPFLKSLVANAFSDKEYVSKAQTMQQNGCLADLIDEAEKRPKQPTLNEKFREVGRNGGSDGVGVNVRGDDRDR